MLEELLGAVAALQELDHVAQPFERIRLAAVAGFDVLAVAPMRGDAALGDVVHLLGADLHLDALAFRPDDGGVDGAVAVGLGRRDEILEALRHHLPVGVQHAERAIAVRERRHDDAEAKMSESCSKLSCLSLSLRQIE